MIEAAAQALAFLNRRLRGDLDTDAMLRLAFTPDGRERRPHSDDDRRSASSPDNSLSRGVICEGLEAR